MRQVAFVKMSFVTQRKIKLELNAFEEDVAARTLKR